MFFEFLEGWTVEFDKGFFDDRHHFTVAAFHVHHLGHRNTAGVPVGGGFCETANRADVACEALAEEKGGGEAERVGVVSIEIRRHGATALVAEIMRLGREAGFVGACGFHFLQARFDEVDEEALGVDAGDLHIAMRIAVEDELVRDVIRQAAIERGCGCCELGCDEFAFLRECF